ncbi:MAG: sulfatase, partial [Verrucomicrobia bacterium]|nr:sulfatase [Verrucomicrobiota bacterium]
SEDNGPFLGCYGDPHARTPHLDGLAAEGVRYRRAFANAPVCSSARTTLITGMYPPSIGAQHHRSRMPLPAGFQLYPELLRAAGYYCTNNAKTDYNVTLDRNPWDENGPRAHYRNRPAGQPFFAIFNQTSSHESQVAPPAGKTTFRVPPGSVTLPPYHPDTPEIRRDWANYHDQITVMDGQMGELLTELAREGLAEDTIVFYYSDHAGGLPRGKRNIHDSGTRVPLIVRFPAKWAHLAPGAPGSWVEQPVSFVDLTATLLELCGVPVPANYEGRPFLGPRAVVRDEVFLFRGRMDERHDVVRAVRDREHRYVRNYSPHRPWGQPYSYPFQVLPSMRSWHAAFLAGNCDPVQAAFWLPKPPEEFYAVAGDPHEVRNLAGRPEVAEPQRALAAKLRAHLIATRDTGFIPEGMTRRLAGGADLIAYARGPAYPIERAVDLADLAAARDPRHLGALQAALADPHPVIRYWGAQGCLILGAKAAPARDALRARLRDDWADVRVAAAEALGHLGDLDAALTALGEVIRAGEAGEVLAALNALDFLWLDGRAPLARVQAMVRGLELAEPADRIPRHLLAATDAQRPPARSR